MSPDEDMILDEELQSSKNNSRRENMGLHLWHEGNGREEEGMPDGQTSAPRWKAMAPERAQECDNSSNEGGRDDDNQKPERTEGRMHVHRWFSEPATQAMCLENFRARALLQEPECWGGNL